MKIPPNNNLTDKDLPNKTIEPYQIDKLDQGFYQATIDTLHDGAFVVEKHVRNTDSRKNGVGECIANECTFTKKSETTNQRGAPCNEHGANNHISNCGIR